MQNMYGSNSGRNGKEIFSSILHWSCSVRRDGCNSSHCGIDQLSSGGEEIILGWIIAVAIVVFFIWRMKPAKDISTISTDELKVILGDKKIQFIDVRTPAEYKGKHIKEFQNIPLHVLNSKVASLKKEQEVVVICQSGMRSSKAASQLKKAGFTVTNVRGGMSAWRG